MFKNVIVGVDGHQGGRDAIALAKNLFHDGAELTLAYVYDGDAHVWRGSSPPYDAAERERGQELLETARADAGLEATLRAYGSSSVGRGLHELAEKTGADLLVIGSSSRGLVGRVMIGDDTHSALNGAACAAAIAPAAYAQRRAMVREIGVGYDGSPESEHALAVAKSLAHAHKSKVSAFEAVFFPARLYAAPAFPDQEELDQIVDEARERVAQLEGVEPHAAYGQPAEELTLYSASLDLLVIGSRSYGPLGRLIHGSTAQHLARTARCPLLVLTRAARKAMTREVEQDGRRPAAATNV